MNKYEANATKKDQTTKPYYVRISSQSFQPYKQSKWN